jgi:predicted  nucleic acid-binding Zn-ribbon protein
MLTPEQLIYDLQSQIVRLEKELEQAQKDIKDFEVLAVEWKRGYEELRRNHNVEIGNLEQEIEELKKELLEFKIISKS